MLKVQSMSGDKQFPAPTYHFFDKTTGRVTYSVRPVYPNIANSYCRSANIAIVASDRPDNFGAFCTGYTKYVGETGYWLWENINNSPKTYGNQPGEIIHNRNGYYLIATRDANGGLVTNTDVIKDRAGKLWLQLNNTQPGGEVVTTTRFDMISNKTVEPYYSLKFRMKETNALRLENPHVSGESVYLLNRGIVVQNAGTENWSSDLQMYNLPKDVDMNYKLFKLKGTWFIVSDIGDGREIWSLQLRQPPESSVS